MIRTAFNGMIAVLLVKFVLNDVPHAIGIQEGIGYCILYHSTPKSVWEEHIKYEGLFPQPISLWKYGDTRKGIFMGTSRKSTTYFTEANFYGAPEVLSEELPKWEPWAVLRVKVPACIKIEPDEEFVLEDGTYGSVLIFEPIPPENIKLVGWITPSLERADEWARTEWII